MRKHNGKRAAGSLIAELPIVLFILFTCFMVPFIDLATVGLRSTFLFAATHLATIEAARAKTFLASVTPQQPSAVALANQQAAITVAAFTGIQVSKITTSILITNVNTLQQSRVLAPLSQAPDSTSNTYQIEVKLTGLVKPLVEYNCGLFANIPGFTAPLPLTFVDRQFCENPQGLTM
jgi:hypothetical protein